MHYRSTLRAFCLALAVTLPLTSPSGLAAQEDLDLPDDSGGTLGGTTTHQVLFENDTFANTDQGYTNGLQYSQMRRPKESLPRWSRPLLKRFPLCVDDDSEPGCYVISSGFVVGQLMYTPEDLEETALILADRPYAGWLYGGVVTELTQRERSGEPLKRDSHRFEINVGYLGPESQADEVQTSIHDWLGFTPINGWDNQIDEGPGFVLQYDYRRALAAKVLSSGRRVFDLTTSAGATAGNIFTNAELGVLARLGYNLSDIFPTGISPVGIDFANVEVYVFAGVTARGVLINETIEGSDVHNLDLESFVNDTQWGFVARAGGFRFQYIVVTRSPEFEPGGRQHRYGSVGLGWFRSF